MRICRSCCGCTCALGPVAGQATCGNTLTPISLTGIGCTGTGPITVSATSNNTALIANPTVTYTSPAATGTVPLTWVAGSGNATISVTVSSPGCTPVTRTALITISPTTGPPTLDPIANQTTTVAGHGALTPFLVTLTGITRGIIPNGSAISTVTAVSSNPAQIANPVIIYTPSNPTGTLQTFPGAGVPCSATITVTVRTNGPGTGCNVNAFARSFLMTFT